MHIPIKYLYEFYKENEQLFTERNVFESGTLLVDTETNFKPVRAIRIIPGKDRDYEKTLKLYFKNYPMLECSENHLVLTDISKQKNSNDFKRFKLAKNIRKNDTVLVKTISNSIEKIELERTEICEDLYIDLYDIQVDDFVYCTNGILSHNSTINSAITYALYGKSGSKKSLTELPNRINKSLETEIDITVDNGNRDNINIHRGISPNIFDVNISGINIDIAGKKNIQDILEREYYGIPFYVFNNIISLSINDFKSFLNMSPADKRSIIDKILGLEILNKMYEYNKIEAKLAKESAEKVSSEKNSVTKNINSIKQTKEEHRRKREESKLKKADELAQQIEEYELHIEGLMPLLTSLQTKKEKIEDGINQINQKISKTTFDTKQLKEKLELLSNDICPTCNASLKSDFHESLRIELEESIRTNIIKINTFKDNILKLKENLVKTSIEYDDIKKKYNEIQIAIQSAKYIRNDSLLNPEVEINFDVLDETILNFSLKLQELENSLNEIIILNDIYTKIDTMLGNTGVKTNIIKFIIPILNKTIEAFLYQLNINFHIQFNDNFDPVITDERGDVISPDSFSTGELKKIDFAVLLSIIQIFKTRYYGLNIIFLDEIFSSVDEDGRNNIISILKEFAKNMKMHIFIINHSELPTELFSSIIEVKKETGFSKLTISETV